MVHRETLVVVIRIGNNPGYCCSLLYRFCVQAILPLFRLRLDRELFTLRRKVFLIRNIGGTAKIDIPKPLRAMETKLAKVLPGVITFCLVGFAV